MFYVMLQASRGESARMYQGILKSVFKSEKSYRESGSFVRWIIWLFDHFIILLRNFARAYGVRIL